MTHHRLPSSVSEPFFFRSAWTRYWIRRRRELTSRIASDQAEGTAGHRRHVERLATSLRGGHRAEG